MPKSGDFGQRCSFKIVFTSSAVVVNEMISHAYIRPTQVYLNKLLNKKLDKIVDDVFENSKYYDFHN